MDFEKLHEDISSLDISHRIISIDTWIVKRCMTVEKLVHVKSGAERLSIDLMGVNEYSRGTYRQR